MRSFRGWFAALLLVSLAWGGGSKAFAQELDWTHFGVRPLGMGNAFVAVADDYNALFYNPAGLARLKTWDMDLLVPKLEVSTTTIDTVNSALEFAGGESGDFLKVLELLEDFTGKTNYASLGFTPNFIMKNFGIGASLMLKTQFVVHREISLDIDAGPELIMPVAVAFNFLEDRLSIGGGLKIVAKGGIDQNFSINDIEAFASEEDEADETPEDPANPEENVKLEDFFIGGVGVGTDFGILFTPIKTMEPTLGISITDFGGTPYKKFDVEGEALGAPATRLPSVNTGLSLKPWTSGKQYLLTAIDAHSVNQPQHYSKKFNLGVEWGYSHIIKVQTGLHQGELTAGFQFDVKLLYIRFATYAEQLGTYAGQDDNLRDRRYALQLKLLL